MSPGLNERIPSRIMSSGADEEMKCKVETTLIQEVLTTPYSVSIIPEADTEIDELWQNRRPKFHLLIPGPEWSVADDSVRARSAIIHWRKRQGSSWLRSTRMHSVAIRVSRAFVLRMSREEVGYDSTPYYEYVHHHEHTNPSSHETMKDKRVTPPRFTASHKDQNGSVDHSHHLNAFASPRCTETSTAWILSRSLDA